MKIYSTVICRKFCFPSMMNKPRNEMPDSSCKTPYERATERDLSANNGYSMFPNPPSFLGVLIHAKWVKCESVETPTTSQLMLRNSCILSEKAMISVGQTKVLKEEDGRNGINKLLFTLLSVRNSRELLSRRGSREVGKVTLYDSKHCAKYWNIMQDSCNRIALFN